MGRDQMVIRGYTGDSDYKEALCRFQASQRVRAKRDKEGWWP